ncbi:MAG: hypothetical protein NTU53_12775 [Planctomycetota bacterium]|nr:hypothetical protein [Planctomycetota bacterium]
MQGTYTTNDRRIHPHRNLPLLNLPTPNPLRIPSPLARKSLLYPPMEAPNLFIAWIGVFPGALAGSIQGLFFHRDDFLEVKILLAISRQFIQELR